MSEPILAESDPLSMRQHQQKASDLAWNCIQNNMPYFGFFMEMGTGKTAATILTLRRIYAKHGRVLRTLIISPSAVTINWKREFEKFSRCGSFVIPVTKKEKKSRLKTIDTCYDENKPLDRIMCVNFGAIRMRRPPKPPGRKRDMPAQPTDVLKRLKEWQPEVVVIDESQRIKSHRSMQAKGCHYLGREASYRYILSGTVSPQGEADIFSQYLFLDNGLRFGTDYRQFQENWMLDLNAHLPKESHFPKWIVRESLRPEMKRLMFQCAFHMTKAEALDLPPLVTQSLEVEMSPKQKSAYTSMKKDFIAYIKEAEKDKDVSNVIIAQTAMTKAMRLNQIVTGFATDDEGNTVYFDTVPRLNLLMETVHDIICTGAKVVIWGCFVAQYEMIAQRLRKEKIKYCKILGGQSPQQTQEEIDRFQKHPGYKVILASVKVAGVGIGLQQASYMIYYDRSWSYEEDEQSEARAHRGGSEIHDKITRINIITPNTVDEKVAEALARKKAISKDLMDIKSLVL